MRAAIALGVRPWSVAVTMIAFIIARRGALGSWPVAVK